jgi:hypothetical protein
MLVPLIITPLDNLSRMRLVFLFCRICKETYIVMDVKIEKRAGFSAGLVNDEVVKGIML